jgi:hypothetical protein
VSTHDLTRQVEPKAAPFRARVPARKRLEQPRLDVGEHSWSFVHHVDDSVFADGNGDLSGAAAMKDGIAYEIGEGARDGVRIAFHEHGGVWGGKRQIIACMDRRWSEIRDKVACDGDEIHARSSLAG